jgi:hypothetical protein
MQRNGIYHQSDEWQRKYCAGTTYNWAEPVSNPAGAIAGGSLCYRPAQYQPEFDKYDQFFGNINVYRKPEVSGISNCVGTPFTVTITVNPTPAALVLSNQEFWRSDSTDNF